jgi:nucleoside-diphosphate-sugar epimerase
VFGAPFPDVIPDDFHPTPLTSYGTQKQMSEALLADYSRRGFFDGIGIRLPTICVRPGKPNKAASGFFSNIIREPLAGKEAVLPVSEVLISGNLEGDEKIRVTFRRSQLLKQKMAFLVPADFAEACGGILTP